MNANAESNDATRTVLRNKKTGRFVSRNKLGLLFIDTTEETY